MSVLPGKKVLLFWIPFCPNLVTAGCWQFAFKASQIFGFLLRRRPKLGSVCWAGVAVGARGDDGVAGAVQDTEVPEDKGDTPDDLLAIT